MMQITMVDVPSKDYTVKVEKTIEMITGITGKSLIFDRSGSLLDALGNHLDRLKSSDSICYDGSNDYKFKNDNEMDREFIDVIIRDINDSKGSGESINLLVINAGKLFYSFSRMLWMEKRARDELDDGDKTIVDRLNDLVRAIRDSEIIKRCIIFNRVVDPHHVIPSRYPGCINALETEGVVERTTVTELVP